MISQEHAKDKIAIFTHKMDKLPDVGNQFVRNRIFETSNKMMGTVEPVRGTDSSMAKGRASPTINF